MNPIPVSVAIVTRNEAGRIERCLRGLCDFDDIWVIDSASADSTQNLAADCGAQVVNFVWDGRYPKKRQWCLQDVPFRYDWVFFLDADEVLTQDFVRALRGIDWAQALECGFFVRARYLWHGKVLRFGLHNTKLAIMHRARMEFPLVDDLDIPGMGEIEGHYQPIRKAGSACSRIGRIDGFMLHDAYDDPQHWRARHERYAVWEAAMHRRGAWPREPSRWREVLKSIFRRLPRRDIVAFVHCYLLKGGFLDGRGGLAFALSRADYYRMVTRLMRQ